MKLPKWSYYTVIGGFLLVMGVAIIWEPQRPLATDYVRHESHAISTSQPSALKSAVEADNHAHAGQSGFELLTKGTDSLRTRLGMIQAAERSIDLQYYIIEDDLTGKLLLEAVLRAADRGVRVRLLMDDLNLRGRNTTWRLLNAHPNIEVRVFNPFATREESFFARASSLFRRISQFSKRMHNKTLIADNQVAMMGGRNIGDSYFGAGGDFNFHDVDVLAQGAVVDEMSQSFDVFWNASEAFPLTALFKPDHNPQEIVDLRKQLTFHWQEAVEKDEVIPSMPLVTQLKLGRIPFLWADAELVADLPGKIDTPKHLVDSKPGIRLDEMAQDAQHEFIIVSSYFVPGTEGVEELQALVKRGVKVRVLTNSLASTDATAAHSGYRRYRQALVEDGVDLYEMQPVPGTHPRSRRFSSSSYDSLHSKIYVVDRQEVILGSFNLDPRSANLNTEMVLVIHSAPLAEQVASMFERAVSPLSSFHVVMHNRHLEWVSNENGEEKRYNNEPKASFWRRIKVNLFALLPFENQL